MTDADLLLAIGRALWGAEFGGQMSEALGVRRARVSDWLSGRVDPPAGVFLDLAAMLAKRRAEVRALRKQALERFARPAG